MVHQKHRSESGQGLVEYALVIVLIAIVLIVALNFLSPRISTLYVHIRGIVKGMDKPNMCDGFQYYLELPDGTFDLSEAGDNYSKVQDGYCWKRKPNP